MLHQAGLNATLNTFVSFEIKPWTDATALACLDALSAHYALPLSKNVAGHMVTLLGCSIPHHVQMFFDHVYRQYKLDGHPDITVEFVDRVYDTSMTGPRGHAELSHMEERLKMVLGGEGRPGKAQADRP